MNQRKIMVIRILLVMVLLALIAYSVYLGVSFVGVEVGVISY